jgi:hypothetical protein
MREDTRAAPGLNVEGRGFLARDLGICHGGMIQFFGESLSGMMSNGAAQSHSTERGDVIHSVDARLVQLESCVSPLGHQRSGRSKRRIINSILPPLCSDPECNSGCF